VSGLSFGPTTRLECRLELDRAQACRGAPIQLAARGERRSLWASFRVAGWAPLAGAVLLLIVPAMALASITLAGRLDPWKPLQQLPFGGSFRL
jgi:hypothetical protein